jgi:sirohydrochlorin cobaltochelatase
VPRRPDDALIVFAHGSTVPEANAAVESVARTAAEASGLRLWQAAFLELAEPSLDAAVANLAAAGAKRIVVTPYFLVMGVHLQQDLPRLLVAAAAARPDLEILATAPLGGHPALATVLAERAAEALER